MKHVPGRTFRRMAISRLNPSSLVGHEKLQDRLLRWVEHALKRGADAVMIRETLPAQQWLDLFEALDEEYPRHSFPILVNGYYGPDSRVQGYHVRENFFALPARLDESFLLGKSCHSLLAAQRALAEGYDYIMFSPVFATDTHPGQIPAGLEELKRVCKGVNLPVFALGGVTDGNEAECLGAGAAGTAAIGRYSLFA